MAKKRLPISLIPSQSTRIRSSRVRVGLILLAAVAVLLGYAGFFIPFSTYTSREAEYNIQKRNLAEQNKKLLLRIHNLYKLNHQFGGHVEQLEAKKKNVEKAVNIPLSEPPAEQSEKATRALTSNDLDTVLNRVSRQEQFYGRLVNKVKENPQFFNELPIHKPLGDQGVLTAKFGKMNDPFTGNPKFHAGLDFAAMQKVPVMATANGEVISVENHRLWGWRVQIRHSHGFITVYAHMGEVLVSKGRRVSRGDAIGTIGVSGLTTGPHVHYELWRKGKPVNPEDYFYSDPNIPTDLVFGGQ
jgi:murein DD-endopeptidase MepM/ murein hydrolase activator NlpD